MEERMKTFCVAVDANTHQTITKLSINLDRSRTWVVRQAVEMYASAFANGKMPAAKVKRGRPRATIATPEPQDAGSLAGAPRARRTQRARGAKAAA